MSVFPFSNLLDGTKKLATKIYNATGELFTPDNPGSVQLLGRNIVEVPVIDALAIADTDYHNSEQIDLKAYKSIVVIAFSTLDQDVSIQPIWDTNYGIGSKYWSGTEWTQYAAGARAVVLPTGWGGEYYLNSYFTEFNNVGIYTMRWSVKCPVAPTTGSVTVKIWGVPN